MQYGTRIELTQMIGGTVAKRTITYTESVRISSDTEALAVFTAMLEQFSRGELTNPGIQLEVYPDSGKVKRVVKSWSETV